MAMTLLQAFRRKAVSWASRYVHDEAVDLIRNAGRVQGVRYRPWL